MHRRKCTRAETQARRMLLCTIAQIRGAPRFVQRGPRVDTVAEAIGYHRSVVGQRVCGFAIQPTAFIAQILRQIPMVERYDRLDAALQQCVDDALVEVEAPVVDDAVGRWHDARHGDRKTVGVNAEILEQRQILAPTVIRVRCHITGIASQRGARGMAERVPNRGAATILVRRTLNLIRRRSRTKYKILRKSVLHCTSFP